MLAYEGHYAMAAFLLVCFAAGMMAVEAIAFLARPLLAKDRQTTEGRPTETMVRGLHILTRVAAVSCCLALILLVIGAVA
jgi:Na+/proline symporter